MSYVLNFIAEILLFLTYDLDLSDHTTKNSPCYVMWVAGLEVQITTNMSRFPAHFHGQFWTPLHDQNVLERKGEFYGMANNVNMVTKLLQSCWSM
jgi:hypothetical protein